MRADRHRRPMVQGEAIALKLWVTIETTCGEGGVASRFLWRRL